MQIGLEKSPRYFVDHHVPDRIAKLVPNVKLILLIRNPVDRLVSDWVQLQGNRLKHNKRQESLETVCLDSAGQVDPNAQIVRNSRYSEHLRVWMEKFNSTQLKIVDGDALVREPALILNEVEHFLNVTSQITASNFVYNETKGFFCMRSDNTSEPRCLNESKGRSHPNLSMSLKSKLTEYFHNESVEMSKMTGIKFNW